MIVRYMTTKTTITTPVAAAVGGTDGIGDALHSYWTDGDAPGDCGTPYDAPPGGYPDEWFGIRALPTDTEFGASTETHGD